MGGGHSAIFGVAFSHKFIFNFRGFPELLLKEKTTNLCLLRKASRSSQTDDISDLLLTNVNFKGHKYLCGGGILHIS